MAEIIQSNEHDTKKRSSVRRCRKHHTHLDMTPMVDLMCLLITFFMLTTAFAKPKIMEITMPQDGVNGPPLNEKRVINIIISGNDNMYWYPGLADEKVAPLPSLTKIGYDRYGLRKLLLERNKTIAEKVEDFKSKIEKGELVMADSTCKRMVREMKKSDRRSPVVLIKADETAKYRNIVDVIDEMAICHIASYAVVDLSDTEKKMIEKVK